MAVPAILHSLLQTLVFIVDRAMLGHHGAISLAGMQIAGPVEWSLWSVCSAFEVGTIARVGRHVGAKDPDAARSAAVLSLVFAVSMGLALSLVSPLFLAHLGDVAPKASPAAIASARSYLAVTLPATPLVFVGVIAIATLQASGDTKTPLVIGVAVNVIHVPLNRLLILGGFGVPPMGPRGCAISTAFTFTLEAALAFAVLARAASGRPVSLRRRGGGPIDPKEGRAVLSVAFPSIVERLLYHTGFLGFVLIIARLGDTAMAANQALISVESICFLSGDGFGIAAAALVAQKLGARRPEDAERSARIAVGYAIALLTALGALFLAGRSVVLPLFSSDPGVLAAGAAAVPVLAVAQPFMATGIVLGQSLRGGGYTREVLGVSAVSALVVRLACTWTLAITMGLGLTGVWLGSTCDWFVRALLLSFVGRRRARALTRAAPAA